MGAVILRIENRMVRDEFGRPMQRRIHDKMLVLSNAVSSPVHSQRFTGSTYRQEVCRSIGNQSGLSHRHGTQIQLFETACRGVPEPARHSDVRYRRATQFQNLQQSKVPQMVNATYLGAVGEVELLFEK